MTGVMVITFFIMFIFFIHHVYLVASLFSYPHPTVFYLVFNPLGHVCFYLLDYISFSRISKCGDREKKLKLKLNFVQKHTNCSFSHQRFFVDDVPPFELFFFFAFFLFFLNIQNQSAAGNVIQLNKRKKALFQIDVYR